MSPQPCGGHVERWHSFGYGELVHLEVGARCDRLVMVSARHRVINRDVYRGVVLWDLEADRPCGGEVRFNGYQVHLAPEAYTA